MQGLCAGLCYWAALLIVKNAIRPINELHTSVLICLHGEKVNLSPLLELAPMGCLSAGESLEGTGALKVSWDPPSALAKGLAAEEGGAHHWLTHPAFFVVLGHTRWDANCNSDVALTLALRGCYKSSRQPPTA